MGGKKQTKKYIATVVDEGDQQINCLIDRKVVDDLVGDICRLLESWVGVLPLFG